MHPKVACRQKKVPAGSILKSLRRKPILNKEVQILILGTSSTSNYPDGFYFLKNIFQQTSSSSNSLSTDLILIDFTQWIPWHPLQMIALSPTQSLLSWVQSLQDILCAIFWWQGYSIQGCGALINVELVRLRNLARNIHNSSFLKPTPAVSYQECLWSHIPMALKFIWVWVDLNSAPLPTWGTSTASYGKRPKVIIFSSFMLWDHVGCFWDPFAVILEN